MSIPEASGQALLVQPGKLVPGFALPDADGAIVRLKAFRQRRPVLIALLHSATCPECRAWLMRLCAAHGDLASHNVQPLLIIPDDDPATLRVLAVEFGMPGVFLSDPQGDARARYLHVDSTDVEDRHLPVLLIAVGRYNDCLNAWIASEPSQWPPLSELIATFAFAEQEDCACGLPSWQDD